MQKDWGYAALIEYGGKRILFDTGNNGDILAQNAKAKGIDLSKLDFVVMSHRHGDHMGGLAYLLSVNPKVKIYAPKEGLDRTGSADRVQPCTEYEARSFEVGPERAHFRTSTDQCGEVLEHQVRSAPFRVCVTAVGAESEDVVVRHRVAH